MHDDGFRECRNTAQWRFWRDKYNLGYATICTACMFALFENGLSHAEPIKKTWLLRKRCGFAVNYRRILDSRLEWYLTEGRWKENIVVSDEALFRSSLVTLSSEFEEGVNRNFDIQIDWGLDRAKRSYVESKADWLGRQFAERLNGSAARLEGVRYRNETYFLCCSAKGGIRLSRIDKDLIDDMRDPEKPKPDTKAKFRAWIDREIKELLKEKV